MGDAAGAEGQDHIAGLGQGGDGVDGLLERGGVVDMRTAGGTNASGEDFGGDPFDRLLAGGIDVDEAHGVGVGEGGGEFVHEIAGAGEAVGLEEDVDAVESALASGCEGGANFGGMMAVIVDDADAAG